MIASTAAKHGRAIEPLLSLSIDFYVRLFIRVVPSAAKVKYLASNTMVTYNCTACGSWTNQHLGRTTEKNNQTKFHTAWADVDSSCPHCGGRQEVTSLPSPTHLALKSPFSAPSTDCRRRFLGFFLSLVRG